MSRHVTALDLLVYPASCTGVPSTSHVWDTSFADVFGGSQESYWDAGAACWRWGVFLAVEANASEVAAE